MIDMHCHILPAIDDGPRDMASALKLAELAVKNGITKAVLTPHIYPARWDNQRSQLECELDIFKLHLKTKQIPLDVYLGGEVRIGDNILPLLEQDQIPFLGSENGLKIMLLEFPDNMIPVGSEQLIRYFLKNGIRPLIAHPERNSVFQAQADKVQQFLDLGCWLQITAGSLCKQFGSKAQKAAEYFLEENWVKIVASDCHNVDYRPPNLNAGHAAITALHGKEYADLLTIENPMQIIGNRQ